MSHVQVGPSKAEVQCRIEHSDELLTQDSGWGWEQQGISLGPLLPDVSVSLQCVTLGYTPSLTSGWLFNGVKWKEKQYTNKFGCKGKEAIRGGKEMARGKEPSAKGTFRIWKEQLKSQSKDWYSREKRQFRKWEITGKSTLLIYVSRDGLELVWNLLECDRIFCGIGYDEKWRAYTTHVWELWKRYSKRWHEWEDRR